MKEPVIAARVERDFVAAGKWGWEIRDVRSKGVLCQIVFNVNARHIRWLELVKVVKEMGGRVNTGMSAAIRAGVPVTMSSLSMDEPEIVEEDGKLKVFANVSADWVPGTMNVMNVGWDDVEEWMTEANLL